MVDEIAPTHVEHRTYRNKSAEAYLFAETPVQHGGTYRAALTDESYIAGSRNGVGKGGIEAGNRTHHAQTIGSNQAHARGAGVVQQLLFELDAMRTGFTESG